MPTEKEIGKVYIASMNMRGKWADRPKNTKNLNVTSMQAKMNPNRLEFSPMTMINGGYRSYCNFESFWQSGKFLKVLIMKRQKLGG